MNHLDFVIWIIGWGFLMGLQDKERSVANAIREVILMIIWIAVAIVLYRGW